jgi:uncharacterized membrane protein YoaK (UPF0700 family)
VAGRQIGGTFQWSPSPLVLARAYVEALLVAVAAIVAAGLSVDAATDRRLLVIALLAAGMGVWSAAVRRLAVPEVTTTVVTSTITALAADPGAPGVTRGLWRLATIAVRLVGALAGALLARVSLFVPFLVVAALITGS